MGVIIEKDCVQKPDGTLICYDAEDKCYYRLKKTVVTPSELDDADILALMDKFASKKS
jgi:hypothetical protein